MVGVSLNAIAVSSIGRAVALQTASGGGGVIARYVSHSLPVCKPVALRAGASNALLVHSFQQAAYGVGTSTWHVGVGQRWWVSVNYNIRYMILWFLTCIKFCNLCMSRRALCWPSVFH